MLSWIRETPITLSIALATIITFLVPSVTGVLEFDTTGSLAGQIPQLFSCHLLHWSFDHLGWDLFMFVFVGMICERKSQLHFVIVLLLSAIAIPILVSNMVPSVNTYRGLSGIDTALFGFAAILMIYESVNEKNWLASLTYVGLFGGMLGKIGYELASGGTLFCSSDCFSPVPIAHIVGASVGTIVALSTMVQNWVNSNHQYCRYQRLPIADEPTA